MTVGEKLVAKAAEQAEATTAPEAKKPAYEAWKWEESQDAGVAYGTLTAVLALGAVSTLGSESGPPGSSQLDLFYFVSLAVCTHYIGAHRSLSAPNRAQISIKEGLIAPLAASVSLFTCYLLVTFLPDLDISKLINAYFWLLSTFACTSALQSQLTRAGKGNVLGAKSIVFDNLPDWILGDEQGKPVTRAEISPADILSVVGGLGLATAHLFSQNWTLNNLMACLIASDILQLVGIRSFRVAGLLLVGLLLYDVFWVFASPSVVGNNVMLTVATSDVITGPSRLLFPRELGGVGEAANYPFSLLGLGDIALPGLLACLALRYDASKTVDMKGRAAVALQAMKEAMKDLDPSISSKQAAQMGAEAAEDAYDLFADAELRQRNRTLDGSNQQKMTAEAGSTSSSSTSSSNPAAAEQRIPVSDAVLEQREYYLTVQVAYIIGLLTAFAANSITHMGQPALLYIVPCTLGAVILKGASRAELSKLYSFTDVPSYGVGTLNFDEEQKKLDDNKSK
ncbi:signal peptide peptidase-like protein [Dunaliella salina]|uniref:Signal peptide peptidase-like protein n=1 Tax=Dunaliella salina TaxID=3046 RepID=A0ABQ7GQ71_DUNSA|nr:signal peptide peptidase-like protein [Dunaliella salina]|eukprot:KAF5836765.1 signal peptide peptidase-like protein [Dunaliella salina]